MLICCVSVKCLCFAPSLLPPPQKLHSRILDLSSGDLLSEVERNRSLVQARSADAQMHVSVCAALAPLIWNLLLASEVWCQGRAIKLISELKHC